MELAKNAIYYTIREERIMSAINIEEIGASDRLKKDKCSEAKKAMKDILSDGQKEKFDKTFEKSH